MPYLRKRIKGSQEGAGEISLGLITFPTFAEDWDSVPQTHNVVDKQH